MGYREELEKQMMGGLEDFMARRGEMEKDSPPKGRPETDGSVLKFIADFMACAASDDDEYEVMRSTFRAGYCWHFAHLLKNVFQRGEVCWAAPYGHFIWVDEDGVPYDAEGVNFGDQLYEIPERYLGNMLDDFRHVPGREYNASVSELTAVIRRYEDDSSLPHQNLDGWLEEGPMHAYKVAWNASGHIGSYYLCIVAPSRERCQRMLDEYVEAKMPAEAERAWHEACRAMELHCGGHVSIEDLGGTDRQEGCYRFWDTGRDHLDD